MCPLTSVKFVLIAQVTLSMLTLNAISTEYPKISSSELQIEESGLESDLPFVTVQAGDSITLRCVGERDIQWSAEDTEIENRFVEGELILEPREQLPYTRTYSIDAARYSDTGTFTCRYRGTNIISEVYLFVESMENLFRKDKFFSKVNVAKREPTFLGCRPTSSSVEMRILSKDKDDITESLGKNNMSYSAQMGLWTLSADISRAGIIGCTAKLGGKVTEQIMYLTILNANVNTLQSPRISKEIPAGPQVGGSLTLVCTIEVNLNDYVSGISMNWNTPSPNLNEDLRLGRIVLGEEVSALLDTRTRLMGLKDWRSVSRNITVHNLTLADSGTYTCWVNASHISHPSEQSKIIKVLHSGGTLISDFNFGGGGSLIELWNHKDEMKWLFDVEALPRNSSQFKWFLPAGDEVPDQQLEKYTKEIRRDNVKLSIKDVTIYDMGEYPFEVSIISKNGEVLEKKTTVLELVVRQNPKLTVSVDGHNEPFFKREEFYTISCEVVGFPIQKDSLSLYFYPCSSFNSCDTTHIQKYDAEPLVAIDANKNPDYNYRFVSSTLIQAEQSGQFECRACGKDQVLCEVQQFPFFLSESETGFAVLDSQARVELVEGDDLNLTCVGSTYLYERVYWKKGDRQLSSRSNQSADTLIQQLHVAELQFEDGGVYDCVAVPLDGGDPLEVSRTVEVLTVLLPEVVGTNMNDSKLVKQADEKLELLCDIRGRPTPVIKWYKDGVEINKTGNEEIDGNFKLSEDNRSLRIHYLRGKNSGEYSCVAVNRGGSYTLKMTVEVVEPPDYTNLYLALGCSLSGIVIIITICITVWNIRVYRRKLRVLTAAELQLFENGDPESINPEMGVDEQADLLPYKSHIEFPKDRLKLGKQLGSGAFGRVLKAEATGINSWEPVSVVAVKMVKPQADITYIKALMSELKIMSHLGKHLNIVNLLGACTQDLNKRELYVIVEYCRFGNLQKYLIRHRNSFVSQIDPNTGYIDFSIGKYSSDKREEVDYSREREVYETSAHYATSPSFVRSASEFAGSTTPEGYIEMRSPEDARNQFTFDREKSVRYTKEPYLMRRESSKNGGEELGSDMTAVTNIQVTGDVESRASRTYSTGSRLSRTGPGWRSNIRGDYRSLEVKPLTTKDLVCWAYQVARGMEYLSSKKVMHGDLACRNILLAGDNVVKICDFGLAKDIYRTNNYQKKSDGPLPVKWLAVECLRDRIFSTQSDIWAYGIVLWEMFTLGKTPYPGLEAGERFYEMLVKGYRMPKPHYCPRDIYKTMLDCWDAEPMKRPRFSELTSMFGDLLEDGEKENYIIMSQRIEESRLEEGKDYLHMMSQPDYQKIINGGFDEENGYLVPNTLRADLEDGGYLLPNKIETTMSQDNHESDSLLRREPLDPVQDTRNDVEQ